MTNNRNIIITETIWHGITVRISYEADWLNSASAYHPAHLQIEAVKPERAALPITETGYKSHFVDPGRIEDAGGPVAYAIAWLDAVAAEKWWREREQAARQLSLF